MYLQAKYGFVAFSDPEDFLKAWKEMDGVFFLVGLIVCLTQGDLQANMLATDL